MAITVENLRAELVHRAKELIEAVGMSIVTDASNDDLDPVLSQAATEAGVAILSGLTLQDSDIAEMTVAQARGRLGIIAHAEYRLLATIRNRWVKVDQRISMGEFKFNQIRESLDLRLKTLGKDLGKERGLLPLTVINLRRDITEPDPALTVTE